MAYFVCKHCGVQVASFKNVTVKEYFFSFDLISPSPFTSDTTYKVVLERCTSCHSLSVRLVGVSDDVETIDRCVVPSAVMRHFPDYVPAAIRADYEEACTILQYSPKSAATLSRRCLEGILQDFFGIKERNLFSSLEKVKPQLASSLWKAIDSLRKIGNIGAHMQQDVNILLDVDRNEAAMLVKLIERLIDGTYVARHDDDALFTAVAELGDS